MTTPHGTNETPASRVADLREQMYRIIDELGSERSDASALKEKFEALWKAIGPAADPTIH